MRTFAAFFANLSMEEKRLLYWPKDGTHMTTWGHHALVEALLDGSIGDNTLRLLLFVDFTKFFNYAHAWSSRIWTAFKLPEGLRRSI